MVEIAEAQRAPGGDHVAFVNAETESGGHHHAQDEAGQDQAEHLAIGQARLVRGWGGDFEGQGRRSAVCGGFLRPAEAGGQCITR